jgi:hypothetical protein
VDNPSGCNNLGVGVCKREKLEKMLESGNNLKDIRQNPNFIMALNNGTVVGGLKGRNANLTKEKTFTYQLTLDFTKGKIYITGKNIQLEKHLETNTGYTPCFFAGCCFRNFT